MPHPSSDRSDALRNGLALLCFFLSGVAGLVYEVAWIRQASLVFGSTTYALSTVLAVFFLGLAAGSFVFGRLTARFERPLRVYAVLEVLLALFALLSIPAFAFADGPFGGVYRATGGVGPWLGLVRFGLVALILLPPTFLMGATLPLFCRQFVLRRSGIAVGVGFLYGINTLGAAVGCLVAGFWLIPLIGLRASIMLAAALNVVAGVVVGAMRRARPQVDERDTPAATAPPAPLGARATIGALFFLTGFAVLGHEVLWTRFIALLVRNTVYTYTMTLGVVLIGIVLGSMLAATFIDRAAARARWFGVLQAALGISVMALMTLPPAFWQRFGTVEVIFMLLLLPAVFSGASFPLVVRMVVDDPALAGAGVGRMYAINTCGGIAGSLAVGFVLLPHLGLEVSARITTGIGVAIAAVAWLVLDRRGPLVVRALVSVASVALWIIVPRIAGVRLPADYLAPRAELVAYREGLESNLAVLEKRGTVQLEIDRWWQGEARKTHQIMAAHVPMLLHPQPKRVLVVGVGAGQTPERFLMYDLERLDCVDIEPAVFDVIRPYFPSAWMDDPRVRLVREDGRNFIAHTDARYDIVSLELGQIFRPGVASFYTEDFYRQVRARLDDGGLVSQFIPLPFVTPEMARGILRTFTAVFPASVLWYNTSELLLIGVKGDRLRLDPERLKVLESNAQVRDDLHYSQWGGPGQYLARPSAFLGGALTGTRGLAALSDSGAIYRDDRPVLAYQAAAVGIAEGSENELSFARALHQQLEPVSETLDLSLPADTVAAITRMREANANDLLTAALLRRFDLVSRSWPPGRLRMLAQQALKLSPDDVAANRVVGQVMMVLGRLDEAERYLAKAVAFDSTDVRALRSLALVLHQQRRPAEAVPYYRAAIALEPDAELHFNLGAALFDSGDRDQAVTELRRALALDPSLERAHELLARIGAR